LNPPLATENDCSPEAFPEKIEGEFYSEEFEKEEIQSF
jgi:hypothetical protein